jgi:hypothetical protein
MAKNGYRTTEPEPMERESSQLLTKVLDYLQNHKLGRTEIAKNLCVSVDEINALTFKLTRLSVVSGDTPTENLSRQPPRLRLV